MWYTYILKSIKKNWYYVGSTNQIERRLKEHNGFKVKSTKPYAPLIVVYYLKWNTEKEARNFEKRIKNQRILKESILKNL